MTSILTSQHDDVRVIEADARLWSEYADLAARCYGHDIPDVARLFEHADTRVAVRGTRVVAGGIGMLIPQFFGGRPIPSACMSLGCVAPEERGNQLIVRVLAERTAPLQQRGAVLSSLWTTSTGYGHHAGWEAPIPAYTWTVPCDQLKRSFTDRVGHDITYGTTTQTHRLQETLAARWNGPLLRPPWWEPWKKEKLALHWYHFRPPGLDVTGLLGLAYTHTPGEGARLVVHDFWAENANAAEAMFSFLGRHNSRLAEIHFQRTGLPPHPQLAHHLHRAGSVSAHVQHPWMLRILDPAAAVALRGWNPRTRDLTLPVQITVDTTTEPQRCTFTLADGAASLTPTTRDPLIEMTQRQFTVWYAGGYPNAPAAAMAGIRGDPSDIAALIATTNDRSPWMPDHF